MDFENLSDEQKAKVRACKTPEELYALAAEEGSELSEAELEAISGGWELGPCFDAECDTYRCGVIGH